MQHPGSPETALTAAIIAFYGFFILLSIAAVVLLVMARVDCARREFADSTEKLIWVLVILFGRVIGLIVYYYVGRQRGRLPGTPPPEPA
jgi:prolipoprotein diacylglyceryltransferase